jgi:Holliday junction resolvase RusA-like endonuclease
MSFTKEQVEEMRRRVMANATKHAYPDVNGTGRGLLDRMGPLSVIIDIDPIGAPRQTRRDAWKPSPAVQRYRTWKDKMRPACNAAGWKLGSILHAEFEIAMPASWSKKKKTVMNGQPHQQKPDIDNCCKALMDLEGTNDGHVHMLNATKRWAEKGRIILYR